MSFGNSIAGEICRRYVNLIVFIVLAFICLGGIMYVAITSSRRVAKEKLSEAYYSEGKDQGYAEGMEVLEVYKRSAIESGVAKYVIVDELKGTTSFCWVLPNGSNVVTMLR